MADNLAKKIMIVTRKAPHGLSNAREALDAMLMGSAFTPQVSIVFMDDGVFQIKKNQDSNSIEIKSIADSFKAFSIYDIESVFVEKTALLERHLNTEDLIIAVKVLESTELSQLMKEQDIILSF